VKRFWMLVLVVAGLVLAACSSSGGAAQKPADLNDTINSTGQFSGVGLDPAQPRPSFTLTDTSGKPFSFQSTSGHPTFLFFGYTNCPDVCPASMMDIHDALTKVPAATQAKTYVVFVSTDVAHDTGPVIARWLQNFTPGIRARVIGLRGTQSEIDAAQAASHIPLASDDGHQHSALVVLYGKDDYARVEYPQSTNESALMAHDLPLVA
jgi:protein SCO1/2